MTTPPDASLPSPNIGTPNRWHVSPAFRIQWLCTRTVSFKAVHHIKNPYVRDDYGLARPVLIGRDGQEIAPEAGQKLLTALQAPIL